MIIIEAPGCPVPYRERQTFRGVAPDGRPLTHSYRAKNLVLWQEAVGWAAKAAMIGRAPVAGAVRLDVTFFMPIPKAMRKADRLLAEQELLPHIKRPDRTQLLKAIEDPLTGIVWTDDSQVCAGDARKVYSKRPRVRLEVSAFELRLPLPLEAAA